MRDLRVESIKKKGIKISHGLDYHDFKIVEVKNSFLKCFKAEFIIRKDEHKELFFELVSSNNKDLSVNISYVTDDWVDYPSVDVDCFLSMMIGDGEDGVIDILTVYMDFVV